MRRDRRIAPLQIALLLSIAGCEAQAPAPDRPAPTPKGTVKITSSPSGAAVLLNKHQRVGKTPMVLERAGDTRVDILLVKDGYDQYHRKVFVPAGKQLLHHAELRARQAQLIVSGSGIVGANIYLDGALVSKTPSRVEVRAGAEHLIEVKKQGFQPYRELITAEADKQLEVDADLIPLGKRARPSGWLRVEAKGKVMVHLDGRPLGSTPLRRIRISARSHKLMFLSLDKKRSRTVKITVKAGEVLRVNGDLETAKPAADPGASSR